MDLNVFKSIRQQSQFLDTYKDNLNRQFSTVLSSPKKPEVATGTPGTSKWKELMNRANLAKLTSLCSFNPKNTVVVNYTDRKGSQQVVLSSQQQKDAFIVSQLIAYEEDIPMLMAWKSQFGPEVQRKIMAAFRFEQHRSRKILFSCGKSNEKCFIVYQGEVDLLRPYYSQF